MLNADAKDGPDHTGLVSVLTADGWFVVNRASPITWAEMLQIAHVLCKQSDTDIAFFNFAGDRLEEPEEFPNVCIACAEHVQVPLPELIMGTHEVKRLQVERVPGGITSCAAWGGRFCHSSALKRRDPGPAKINILDPRTARKGQSTYTHSPL